MYNVPYIKHLIKHLCVDLHACIKYLRNDYRMPRCLEGYIPSEAYLYCYGSLMRPSSFQCIPNTTYANYETPGSRPLDNLMARLFELWSWTCWRFIYLFFCHPLLGSQVKRLWLLLLKIGNASWAIVNRHVAIGNRQAIIENSWSTSDDLSSIIPRECGDEDLALPALNLGSLQTPPRWLFSFCPSHSG